MSADTENSAASTSTTATDMASYQQFALEQQAKNNAWSAEQAQKQMDFQKEMSNTAHQREVADLKAAGLNPILSANSGASVPNGAQAEGDKSAAGNVGQILQQVLQAQSAREVAGMYNAATIAAASIAANASMYGSDMAYQNTEDHPNTLEAVAARALQSAFGGNSSGAGSGIASSTGSILSSLVSAVSGIGNGIPVDTSKAPTAALTAAGVLGNKSAAYAAGQRLAEKIAPPVDYVKSFGMSEQNYHTWMYEVYPKIRKMGIPSNEGVLKNLRLAWLKGDGSFEKMLKGYLFIYQKGDPVSAVRRGARNWWYKTFG